MLSRPTEDNINIYWRCKDNTLLSTEDDIRYLRKITFISTEGDTEDNVLALTEDSIRYLLKITYLLLTEDNTVLSTEKWHISYHGYLLR